MAEKWDVQSQEQQSLGFATHHKGLHTLLGGAPEWFGRSSATVKT